MEAAADGPSWMKRQDSAVGRKEAAVAKYIQQREDFKEDPYAAFDPDEPWVIEALDWVREVTKDPLTAGLTSLKDGRILCKLVNSIQPGTIQVINKCSVTKKQQALLCMENLKFFLDGCTTLGVSSNDLFLPPDLYADMNRRQAIICIAALGRCTHNSETYQGAAMGHAGTKYKEDHTVDDEAAAEVQARLDEVAAAQVAKVEAKAAHTAARAADQFHGTMEEQVKAWSEAVVGEAWASDDLWEAMHDGFFMCKLANAIKPKSVNMKKLHKSSIAFMCMENIGFFCKATQKLGVKPSEQFRPGDLYEKGKSYPKQVWITLWALGHSCEDVEGYTGPTLNH